MNKQIHVNSRIAWERLSYLQLTNRQKKILDWFGWANKPMTERQAKEGLGLMDMNNVRPRITELVKMGCLTEHSHIKCPVTKARVRRLVVANSARVEPQQDLFD